MRLAEEAKGPTTYYFSGKIDLNRDFPKWYHHKTWELADRREDLIFSDRERETKVRRVVLDHN